MAAAAFATVQNYTDHVTHIGITWNTHMMAYKLMQKWNLLLLNFPTEQFDVLVFLYSNDYNISGFLDCAQHKI